MNEITRWECNPQEYIREFNELYYRGEHDQLDDEENDLLERHYYWKQEQSLKRLPQKGCVPTDFIEEARWYEYHAQVGSKSEFLQEPGKDLAREMVLYYHSVQERTK